MKVDKNKESVNICGELNDIFEFEKFMWSNKKKNTHVYMKYWKSNQNLIYYNKK